ncbi:hypothetical protein CRUP_034731 [Coryphaenoides rupestris]|nr:hypothetical protein CRUP_034731 [Coryphaenoides rupestris]
MRKHLAVLGGFSGVSWKPSSPFNLIIITTITAWFSPSSPHGQTGQTRSADNGLANYKLQRSRNPAGFCAGRGERRKVRGERRVEERREERERKGGGGWREERAQSSVAQSQANRQISEHITELEQEVTRHKEEAGRGQQEVERLLDILREMENEKNEKDKKIHDLESCGEGNKPRPRLPLSQWGRWCCGTTWAREWLVSCVRISGSAPRIQEPSRAPVVLSAC